MRILAIRGENLASLAATFEIDLTRSPLSGAGLFAITGETGAGKSTILDALCLALYGEYPRVTVDRNEKTPDPSGEEITVKDARAILRRGAGAGFAEVDFTGVDGISYRVRWETSRARGRANGRLQGEQRSLKQLKDGLAVASGKTAVDKAVIERTDLTYDQFRRTVLLAQGEFDAFLLARDDSRAELLEKITGTEIYALISIGVRRGTDERRKGVDALVQRRAQVGVLEAAARGDLQFELAQLTNAAAESTREQQALTNRLAHFERIAEARQYLQEAETTATEAQTAVEAASEDRIYLAELDIVEPIRPLSAAVESADRLVRETGERGAAAGIALEAAQESAVAARGALEHASSEAIAREEQYNAFKPLWTRAEQLDAVLVTAENELSRAREEADRAAAEEVDVRQRLAVIDAAVEETGKHLQPLREGIAVRQDRAVLAERLPEAQALVRARITFAQEREAVAAAGRELEQQAEALQRELESAEERITLQAAERSEVAQRLARLRGEFAVIDVTAHESRESSLANLLDLLTGAAAIAANYDRACAGRAQADSDLTTAQQEIADLRTRREDLEKQQAELLAKRREIAAISAIAEEVQSKAALQLRSILAAGEPCPVCGSSDHPYAAHPDAINEMVLAIRARRAELDAAIEAGEAELLLIARAAASAEFRQAEAARAGVSAGQQAASAVTAYMEAYPPLCDTLLQSGTAVSLSSELAGGLRQELDALLIAARSARAENAVPLAEAKRLRGEIDPVQERHQELTGALESLHTVTADQRLRLHGIELKRNEASVRGSELQERLHQNHRDVAPYLAAAERTMDDLNQDADAVIDAMARAASDYGALQAEVVRLEAALTQQALQRATAAAERDAAAKQWVAATAGLGDRQETAAIQRAARAALLDGEPTTQHRSRVEADWRSAREAVTGAHTAVTTSTAALEVAQARHIETLAASASAAARQQESSAIFEARCAECGREPAVVREFLATSADRREAIRERLRVLDADLHSAVAVAETRRSNLQELLAGLDEAAGEESVKQALQEVGQRQDEIQQRLGAVKADLARDDAAREASAGLTAEIDAAGADLKTWQEVDAAVGSAGGDSFRKFVQGITLDHLVRLANSHLAALSPRYRLFRPPSGGLSIHVVDRDLGDEPRATRSLSGGERFLVSLALALALSGLEGRQSFVDTLFIDEGFGALDAETLDMAIDALETLQSRGRKVGVITHVAAMIERIAVQVRVEKRGGGRSAIRIVG